MHLGKHRMGTEAWTRQWEVTCASCVHTQTIRTRTPCSATGGRPLVNIFLILHGRRRHRTTHSVRESRSRAGVAQEPPPPPPPTDQTQPNPHWARSAFPTFAVSVQWMTDSLSRPREPQVLRSASFWPTTISCKGPDSPATAASLPFTSATVSKGLTSRVTTFWTLWVSLKATG